MGRARRPLGARARLGGRRLAARTRFSFARRQLGGGRRRRRLRRCAALGLLLRV